MDSEEEYQARALIQFKSWWTIKELEESAGTVSDRAKGRRNMKMGREGHLYCASIFIL